MRKLVKRLVILVVTTIFLFGCNRKDTSVEGQKGEKEMEDQSLTQETEEKDEEVINQEEDDTNLNQQVTIAFEVDLEEHDSSLFEMANGWTNGDMFDCTWRQENITFENGIMKLTIDTDGENASPKWSGGEYRTKKFYSYGLYEVRMKPIKNNGVVSSFFTYTGPSDNNPWDEIDIEFLGKDTTKIQFNYFMNGVGEHEYMHDLGFDASEEFHTYAFEWLPDAITWYVDGESVHTATENIPSTPSKVMMNAWPGIGVDAWLNAFDGIIPLNAEYDWIRVTQYDAPVKE